MYGRIAMVGKKMCAGCNNMSYIYKNISGKKYCKSCAYKIAPPVKIKKVSEKKKKQDDEYSKLRKIYLDAHPFCEAKLPGCTGDATDIHHLAGRIGEKYLDVTNFIALCRSCHSYIEIHPKEAKELGFSKNRL